VQGASEILLSFTAAFEHIPLHRRLGLFEHVTKTLGPQDCLYAIVAMIVDRYPTDNRARRFIADLINVFEPSIGLIVRLSHFIVSLSLTSIRLSVNILPW
jgi:U3 small nucleolar RNA-associated protein 10